MISKDSLAPDSYLNGLGIPADCPGNDNVAGTCYTKCPDGFIRVPGTSDCSTNGTAGAGSSYVPKTIPKERYVPIGKT